jgi:hypothetical protein
VATAALMEAAVATAALMEAAVTAAALMEATVTAAALMEATVATATLMEAAVTTAALMEATVTAAALMEATVATATLMEATTALVLGRLRVRQAPLALLHEGQILDRDRPRLGGARGRRTSDDHPRGEQGQHCCESHGIHPFTLVSWLQTNPSLGGDLGR